MKRHVSDRRRDSGMNRRAYLMVEMVVTLGLVAVVAGVATRLAYGLIGTGRELGVGEREALAADRAAATLRHDAERATIVAAAVGDAAGVTFDGAAAAGDPAGRVTWTSDADGLLRTAGGRVDRFGPLPAAATLGVRGASVTLRVGGATWTLGTAVDAAVKTEDRR